jgi:CMP-N-acetylneuraminic acid synthetase
MKAVAIIPARGGSKGIPNKNLKVVGGKTLIRRTIEAALKAETVGQVIVSSDSAEILAEAESVGVITAHCRPDDLSTDEASSESVLLHVLGTMDDQPPTTVFLQCTAPLTTPEDIDGTVRALEVEQADSALAVVESHAFLWRRGLDGATGWNHKHNKPRGRRQDFREREYIETGSVYAFRTESFLKRGERFFGKIALHVIPRERWCEIDEPSDLDIAEALALYQDRRS